MTEKYLNILSSIVFCSLSYSAHAAFITTCPATDCTTNSNVTVGGVTQNRNGIAVGNDIGSSANVTNSSGSVSADALANYGVLRAKAGASSVPNKLASATATANFSDTVSITSGTLAQNTPLQIEVQVWLGGTASVNKGSYVNPSPLLPLPGFTSANLDFGGYTQKNGTPFRASTSQVIGSLDTIAAGGSVSKIYDKTNSLSSTTFNTFVGDTLNISGAMIISAIAGDGTNATADFFSTGHFALVPVGGLDVTLLGKAGSNYGPSAVPLPGAIWMFGTGLLGLLSFKRRKNKNE